MMIAQTGGRPRAVVITYHYWRSRRRASFHYIGAELVRNGFAIDFVTSNVSWMKRWRGNPMFGQPGFLANLATGATRVDDMVTSHIWQAPYSLNTIGIPLLDACLTPLYRLYPYLLRDRLRQVVAGAQMLVFESTAGVILFDEARRINPAARVLYRVSDDLKLLAMHPAVLAAERRLLAAADLVSVPCRYLEEKMRGREPRARVRLHPHGVDKAAFAAPVANPYPGPGNAVLVGTGYIDYDFIARAARLFPDLNFHLIGPLPQLLTRPNVHWHGELPFAATVPYLKHADLGLQARAGAPEIASLSDSLKVQQYTLCRLPIIAPAAIPSERAHWFTYGANDESVTAAMRAALAFDRRLIDPGFVADWPDTVRAMLADLAETSGGNAA